jgi:hypothetical protein
VYDCTGAGTGFMGVTTKRHVFGDNSFVGKRVAVTVSGAKTHEATFRGEDKAAHIHNVILHHLCQ